MQRPEETTPPPPLNQCCSPARILLGASAALGPMTSGWRDFVGQKENLLQPAAFCTHISPFVCKMEGRGQQWESGRTFPETASEAPQFRVARGELHWDSPGAQLAFGWSPVSLRR